MDRNFICLAFFLFTTFFFAQSHTVIGKWKTIDDETGKAIAVVEIFEIHGKMYGKVIEIFNVKRDQKKCEKCPGDDKNKPILGLTVIKGLTKEGNQYSNGKILDPKHGRLYKCTIGLESRDKLKVRGYIGISIIGRTQYWDRIKG